MGVAGLMGLGTARLAWATEALPPSLPEEGMGWLLLKTLVVLGIVVALVYLSLNFGLRKLMGIKGLGPGVSRAVTVLERIPLDPRRTLFLVKVGDEYLLLGGGENSVNLLTHLDREKLEAFLKAAGPASASLSPFLKKLLSRESGAPPSDA